MRRQLSSDRSAPSNPPRRLARDPERPPAQVDARHAQPAPGQLEAVPPVSARDVEHACPRLEAELLDDEVDGLDGPLRREAQRQQVEPVALEPALMPVGLDVHATIIPSAQRTITA
jgi:hypothetical protein